MHGQKRIIADSNTPAPSRPDVVGCNAMYCIEVIPATADRRHQDFIPGTTIVMHGIATERGTGFAAYRPYVRGARGIDAEKIRAASYGRDSLLSPVAAIPLQDLRSRHTAAG